MGNLNTRPGACFSRTAVVACKSKLKSGPRLYKRKMFKINEMFYFGGYYQKVITLIRWPMTPILFGLTSGVTSLSAKPVPPVVRIRSALPESAQDTWLQIQCTYTGTNTGTNMYRGINVNTGTGRGASAKTNFNLNADTVKESNSPQGVTVKPLFCRETHRYDPTLTRWRRMAVWSSGQHSVAITLKLKLKNWNWIEHHPTNIFLKLN